MNYVKIFLLCLLISGCAPLQVEVIYPTEKVYLEKDEEQARKELFLRCLYSEPFWEGKVLEKKFIGVLAFGYDYETIDEFGDYLKKNSNIYPHIIDNWLERVKERYERLEK